MTIVYLCGLYPDVMLTDIRANSKGLIQYGPNKLQHTFLDGLNLFFTNVILLTSPLIGTYPKSYKKIFIRKKQIFYKNKNICHSVSYLNLPFFALFFKSISIFYRLLIILFPKKERVVFIYSPHMPYLFAAILTKLFLKNVHVCLYINDLPEYMSASKNIFYLFAKYIEKKLFNIFIYLIDSFVVVTDLMPKRLNIENKPWIRIEGVYREEIDLSKFAYVNNQKIKKTIILYTGTLDRRYGIENLLEAFTLINESDFELWICGFGDMENEILEKQQVDKRINFYGQLTHLEVLELQSTADILVNPRLPLGEYTKYSFPIKTLEYLASAKPCIMYKLPGIPVEYHSHFYSPEDLTVIALKNKIIEVSNFDQNYIKHNAEQARKFIINQIGIENKFNSLYNFLKLNVI